MEDTCQRGQCKLWRKFGDSCPNYVVSTWDSPTGGQVKTTCDCAPRRTFFMIRDLYAGLIGVQKSNEEQRNVSVRIENFATKLLEGAQRQLMIPFDPDVIEGVFQDADPTGGVPRLPDSRPEDRPGA